MDPLLKQRLVGTVVIVCLAVIFVPMILDGKPPQKTQAEVEMPPQPDWPVNPLAQQQLQQLPEKTQQLVAVDPLEAEPSAEVEEVAEAPKPTAEKQAPAAKLETDGSKASESKTAAAPGLSASQAKDLENSEARPAGESWVLQSGGFKDYDKAQKQRDQLAATKIGRVFIEPLQRADGTIYRVRMGPFLDKAEAQKAGRKILAKLNLKTLLLKFEK